MLIVSEITCTSMMVLCSHQFYLFLVSLREADSETVMILEFPKGGFEIDLLNGEERRGKD